LLAAGYWLSDWLLAVGCGHTLRIAFDIFWLATFCFIVLVCDILVYFGIFAGLLTLTCFSGWLLAVGVVLIGVRMD